MELAEYYNLDEIIDRTQVLNELKRLKKDGKIEYELNADILKIEDIDLEESEIDDLIDLFDSNDVFEELEYGESDWDSDDEGWGEDDFEDDF